MAKLDRAIYSNRQLEAVMEDFWFNHFNVFANKGDDKWLLTSYVRDTIRPHTMGKFHDLLVATAKSPAMLFFLDNWLSADPAAYQQCSAKSRRDATRAIGGSVRRGVMPPPQPFRDIANVPGERPQAKKKEERGLNENYGREVMELHTVGVDAGYTQQDVIEMAECLTGWTVHEPRKRSRILFRRPNPCRRQESRDGPHVQLRRDEGRRRSAEVAGERSAHGAKFISTDWRATSSPTIRRGAGGPHGAANYEKSGGDIRAVLHTMIYSPEFWSKDAYRAKVKTPFELVASTARALNADVDVTLPLVQWVARMGEPLFSASRRPATRIRRKRGSTRARF